MDRNCVRELGTIKEYNCRMANRNLIEVVERLSNTIEELKSCVDSINDPTLVSIDGETYRLTKIEKDLRQGSRELQLAVDDIDATSTGHFPIEYGEIKTIHREDPRDWFFDFVNIGNCHDCPLHAHIRGNKNKPCGAEECIVKQLCCMIGYHHNG